MIRKGSYFFFIMRSRPTFLPYIFSKGSPIHRIVRVVRRVVQVLAVLDPGFGNGSAQVVQAVVHISVLVERSVVPRDMQARWEDGMGAVGRVRRWSPVCENVGLECIKVEHNQGVLVFLTEFVTYGLYHRSTRWETNETCRSDTP
jgi:hypothetical protein